MTAASMTQDPFTKDEDSWSIQRTHNNNRIRDGSDNIQICFEYKREVGEDAAHKIDKHKQYGDTDDFSVFPNLVVLWTNEDEMNTCPMKAKTTTYSNARDIKTELNYRRDGVSERKWTGRTANLQRQKIATLVRCLHRHDIQTGDILWKLE